MGQYFSNDVVIHLLLPMLSVPGIIVFCIAFGLCIGQMGEKARIMFEFFVSLNEVVMRLVGIIMWSVRNMPLNRIKL